MVDDATDRSAGTGQPDAVNTPAAPGPVSNDTTAHFTEDFRSQLAAMEAGVSPEEKDAIAALPRDPRCSSCGVGRTSGRASCSTATSPSRDGIRMPTSSSTT
ncbi:hypothetical protein GCM10025869_33030 [Homoserinibacter gongjuensis]|uniref:Uncharacterized protein n=1 Tax=Homoserinibacter gongjuensis TaxID=1162968 RepID=A0ABQ6JXM6_9MICO|nr:hypothetical protein GCM10025869_33030 [Homoserinibacter gongjuensis]